MSIIRTFTGRLVDLYSPDIWEIDLQDIAHALSQINRFTGHTVTPYSVAEHCIRGSYQVLPEFALEWMLHDASEAYLGYVSKPLKMIIGKEYAALEDSWALAIAARYRLRMDAEAIVEVKRVDELMLRCEMKALMAERNTTQMVDKWSNDFETSIAMGIQTGPMENACEMFLSRIGELIEQRYVALVAGER